MPGLDGRLLEAVTVGSGRVLRSGAMKHCVVEAPYRSHLTLTQAVCTDAEMHPKIFRFNPNTASVVFSFFKDKTAMATSGHLSLWSGSECRCRDDGV